MLTLPLSVPFALFSLWITGRALSLWSALGMFLLLGIVKKKWDSASGLHEPVARGRDARWETPILEAESACGCGPS